VTTGRPELPTPTGTYSVLAKKSPTTFHSPWPKGSPYYYEPTHIEYAMLFRTGGFYIHDAPWKLYHGYGTNVAHTDPDGVQRTGSLGCVEMPAWSATWLYDWASVGTPVVVTSD
jgi:lipoprotein-anchoring transpeptidase ErfK/SrfK